MPMPSPALRRATLVGCCALALAYAVVANVELDRRLADPAAAARLTGRDSRTYLSIAERLARGRFAMRYVKNYPHRQPLYPAALAVVLALRGPDLRALANVNVLAVTLSIVLVGAASLRAFESVPAALTGALLVATNPLLFEESVARLLTEPVFVAWVAAALYALARFFESGRPSLLCTASALLGLAYLTRPNGLFLFAAAWIVAALHTLRRWQKAPAPRPALRTAAAPLALALLVFVAVTLPSWLPRAAHTGNPLNHGYLSDFLWVDRYDEAKGDGLPRYSARDYFAAHDAGDALQRLAYGAGRVLWAVPTREFGTAATLAMLAGALLFVARRRTSWLLVLAVGALQLLPVAWTQLSNPNRRVAAAALLPFGLYAGAFLGSCLDRLVSRAAPRCGSATRRRFPGMRRPPPGGRPPARPDGPSR